jgi:hypothetical protein
MLLRLSSGSAAVTGIPAAMLLQVTQIILYP